MSDEAAFTRAICENPDDDTARLVYADWLEEHGGEPERAELIRAQVNLTAWEKQNGSKQLAGPEQRAVAKAWGKAATLACWDMPVTHMIWVVGPDYAMDFGTQWTVTNRGYVRRGFVEEIHCFTSDWFAFGDELRAHHPVTRVQLLSEPEYDEWDFKRLDGESMIRYVLLGANAEPDESSAIWCSAHMSKSYIIGELLRRRWPGVSFAWPDDSSGFEPDTGACDLCNGSGFPDGSTYMPCPQCGERWRGATA